MTDEMPKFGGTGPFYIPMYGIPPYGRPIGKGWGGIDTDRSF